MSSDISHERGRELHLVGSLPFSTVEEVFAGVRELAPFTGSLPDGEVGPRRLWTPYLPRRTFSIHPDLVEVNRPDWADFLDEGRQELPEDGDYSELWVFRLKDGVTEFEMGDLHYAEPAIESYRVLKRLRESGELPAKTRFQVGLPSTDSVVDDFFAERADWALVKPAYERAAFHEIEKILTEIPAEDLVVQWDLAGEPVDLELDENPWVTDGVESFEAKWERHFATMSTLWRGVPESVTLGYHWCYGTWGGWPMTPMKDLGLCVRMSNEIVGSAGRHVDYVHMPVTRDADAAFFQPLADLDVGDTRVYLGLIHHDDPDQNGLARRVDLAARHLADFGVAGVCGYGRVRASEVSSIVSSHAEAAHLMASRAASQS